MVQFFKNCLFCKKPVSVDPNGEGEHVIPKNIYGFFRIHDICDECKKYFGDNVDHLALKHPSILESMQKLGLPKTGAYLENLPYQGVDTLDGHTLSMLKRGNKYKIKANHHNDEIFECAEEDWEKVNIERIKATVGDTISPEEFEAEKNRVKREYKKIEPGESVESSKLGFSFRKRQASNVELNVDALPSITPLIAKIVTCFLYYAVAPSQINLLSRLDMFKNHSRYNGKLDDFSINWCPLHKESAFEKRHLMRLSFFKTHLFVDIALFIYANWRANLVSNEEIIIKDPENNLCDSISLVLDFSDLNHRQKLLGYRKISTGKFTYYKFPC